MNNNKGTIYDLIYDYTRYNGGKNKLYPSLVSLRELLSQVINLQATTNSIHIIPFYENNVDMRSVEFDNYNFYIECREIVTKEDKINFILECEYNGRDKSIDLRKTHFLIQYDEIEKFREAIEVYIEYFNELLEKMTNELIEYNYSDKDYSHGLFCFDITCD